MQHKFRAWDSTRKKFVYRGLHDKNWYYTPRNDENGCHLAYPVHQSDAHTLKVMQSTGFHAGGIVDEKNEIYADHILQFIDTEGEESRIVNAVVFWNEKYGRWMIRYDNGITDDLYDYYDEAKIIGSVQEKPELLESNN